MKGTIIGNGHDDSAYNRRHAARVGGKCQQKEPSDRLKRPDTRQGYEMLKANLPSPVAMALQDLFLN
jgi:hypothetical protein